jgi:phosphate:Na+ symporter
MNTWMANLIREELITPEMATSLMNDVSYATSIFKNLVQMGETLFIKRAHGLSDAERILELNDDELDAIKLQAK